MESTISASEQTEQPISDRRVQTICLMVLAGVASVYMVYWLRPVLVPFVVACFVVSGVGPILNYLEKRLGVSRLVAAGIAFLAGILLLAVFGITVWGSFVDLSRNSGAYRTRVTQLVSEFEDFLPFELLGIDEALGNSTSGETDIARPALSEKSAEGVHQLVDTFVRDGISVVSQMLVGLVSTSVVVLIYVFFLLIGNPNYAQSETLREIDTQVRNYLSLKTIISIFTGLAFGLTLRLFGVPMALSFGVLAFLLNFVPNIGPIVASLLPIPLIIFDPDGTLGWMLAVIALTSTIQMVSGNIIEPKIMGNAADLHPVSILLALMFWGMMWGIVGMFLATPITAALKIVLERFEPTQPIANLLSGRWNKTPA